MNRRHACTCDVDKQCSHVPHVYLHHRYYPQTVWQVTLTATSKHISKGTWAAYKNSCCIVEDEPAVGAELTALMLVQRQATVSVAHAVLRLT